MHEACAAQQFTCLHMSTLSKPGLSQQKATDLTLGLFLYSSVSRALLHRAVWRASRRHGRAIHREEQGHEGQRTSSSPGHSHAASVPKSCFTRAAIDSQNATVLRTEWIWTHQYQWTTVKYMVCKEILNKHLVWNKQTDMVGGRNPPVSIVPPLYLQSVIFCQ